MFCQKPTEEDGKDDHHGSSWIIMDHHDENDHDIPYFYQDEDDDDVGKKYCFSCRSDTTPNHQTTKFQDNQKQHQSQEDINLKIQ